MTQRILIRRAGTVISISDDKLESPPVELKEALEAELTYGKVQLLRGYARYGPSGETQNVQVTSTRLFSYDNYGAIVTGFGMLTRVYSWLHSRGVPVEYYDMSPERVRPTCYEPNWDKLRSMFEFRPGQEQCLQLIAANQCGIVDATMGFGKGEIFAMLAALYPKAKFHIAVPGADLARSICRRLTKYYSNVGLVGAGQNFFGSRLTVFVANSMKKSDGDADFLLADEVHKMAAPTHSRDIGFTWSATRNFGFTGTCDMRLDQADRELEVLFGSRIYKMGYVEAEALGLVVPITVRWLHIHLSDNPVAGFASLQDARAMRAGVWSNHGRNQLIVDDIRRSYPDDTQILILCEKFEHAANLAKQLPDFELCHGPITAEKMVKYKNHGLVGENFVQMTVRRRDESREGFTTGTVRRVIATDVWATGVDFPHLRVLYRVDARASEIIDNQGPGRLSRIAADKTGAVLVDCYDLFDKRFLRRSEVRGKHYKKLGWLSAGAPARRIP